MAMHTWFECKIRYEKVMENGMLDEKSGAEKSYRTISC